MELEPIISYLPRPMQLSACMVITPAGILVYLGQNGELFEIIGGKNGFINTQKI